MIVALTSFHVVKSKQLNFSGIEVIGLSSTKYNLSVVALRVMFFQAKARLIAYNCFCGFTPAENTNVPY